MLREHGGLLGHTVMANSPNGWLGEGVPSLPAFECLSGRSLTEQMVGQHRTLQTSLQSPSPASQGQGLSQGRVWGWGHWQLAHMEANNICQS